MSGFPVPKTQKQVRSFLGMANYYRRFIHNFAKIAAPLNALLSKDKKMEWTVMSGSFQHIEKQTSKCPYFSIPRSRQILHIDV